MQQRSCVYYCACRRVSRNSRFFYCYFCWGYQSESPQQQKYSAALRSLNTTPQHNTTHNSSRQVEEDTTQTQHNTIKIKGREEL